MSQGQPRRDEQEPIKYGDIFGVHGDLADKPIAPQDAAMMQTAETAVLGQTQKGGPAATMQAAATWNERAGVVRHTEVSDAAGGQGVTVTETDVPGRRIITEAVGGQVVGQSVQPTPVQQGSTTSAITIGEALEATAQTMGDKPVDQSDAAAIQAAEVRATGVNVVTPGGLAATAQSAASYNAGIDKDDNKGATAKLPADKAATRQDAEGVTTAELRNNPNMSTQPGGIAASVTAAARLNENMNI
ncbi:late embryogenesis abundant protein D-34-like isoform X2 [Ziziphus jujuba]|uniref:Late embryogenesis abundant protein D-34-like isoform X2 n=1 Tax=Ziziphus jujuba TaxID=326968 RepID=A0ABM3IRE7_ZIZJJ|nr:late embryogenesis abundant protein D-34-like isoform X2 [Ziziphus jujuba]